MMDRKETVNVTIYAQIMLGTVTLNLVIYFPKTLSSFKKQFEFLKFFNIEYILDGSSAYKVFVLFIYAWFSRTHDQKSFIRNICYYLILNIFDIEYCWCDRLC